jgi:hypothetical protein
MVCLRPVLEDPEGAWAGKAPSAAAPAPEKSSAEGGDKNDSARWETLVATNLTWAIILYAAAHLLLAINWMMSGHPDGHPLLFGQGLFLAGLVPLWRAAMALHHPTTALTLAQRKQAGLALILAMSLSFSPCFWLVGLMIFSS